jgi:hypothetical protein
MSLLEFCRAACAFVCSRWCVCVCVVSEGEKRQCGGVWSYLAAIRVFSASCLLVPNWTFQVHETEENVCVVCICVSVCLFGLMEEFMELGGGLLCMNDKDGFVRLLSLCVLMDVFLPGVFG